MKVLALAVLALLAAPAMLTAQSSASYKLEFDVFDSGGSGPYLSTSSAHRAHSIIGQAAQLHTSSSSSYIASSGAECLFCEWKVSTGINPSSIPLTMQLYQNFPNPFNPTTRIRYVLERPSAQTEIAVYNLLGEKLSVLFNGFRDAGEYTIDFDADQLSGGVYVYRLSTEHGVLSRRMMLLR
jgi:hypothetical protein